MLTIGIETSTNVASIALMVEGAMRAEMTLARENVRHAQMLVPELRQLLQTHGYSLKACERVAVSMGPGSFTGLRIGLVFAKTLAYITKCQLVPVDTLQAIAANAPADVDSMFAVVDAQRGDLYVAPFSRRDNGEWRRTGDVRIVAVKNWVTELALDDVVSGPGLHRYQELIAAACRVLPEEAWIPTAGTVARLGSTLTPLESFEDLAALEPFYLRKSAAEENWALKHGASKHGEE
ncbi:MAG: tRNA (adenosine(37)-N6)-threonylcarbamoyltransferase complex dimerization subunit type 1 TsaB [Planctomyces sp.]|nr:tRNA (adenosine(37)-N6)-threonylcarbamoyltransferase complex dimerization subunit type 1 TsaB [Planctomyces sp.]